MSAFAAAQAAKPMKLTGRVVDPDGFSLVGVTITIKGTPKVSPRTPRENMNWM